MTNLEFIEKEIKFLEDMINMDLALMEDEEDLEEIANKQKMLSHYQQIKTILEAWEVVKGKEVDLYDVIHTKNYQQYEQENYDLLPQYQLTLKDYETIKKALETLNE